MKKAVSILCIFLFVAHTLTADEYGLRLKPLPRDDNSPNLVLNGGEPVRSRGILELSFDVRSIRDEPYGCVCRLIGDRGYVIDLINSVSHDHRWVPLLIAGGKSVELKSDIRWGEWEKVLLQVDTQSGSVTLKYGEEQAYVDVPVIKGSRSFRISFGRCPFDKFDVELASSFDIRDVHLSHGRKLFAEWPLRMHSGNESPDIHGRKTALAENPIWLADELIKPRPLLHLECGKGTCIAFDGDRNFLIVDNPEQLISFDAEVLALDTVQVTEGFLPPANATNQLIYTGDTLLSYNLLGNAYASFDQELCKWSGGKSANETDFYTNYTATWDTERKKLYCFGGYGFFHLYDDLRICDPAHPDSLRIVSLTGISPRCFSSSAMLDGDLYIFGGKGTKSGNQELAQDYNYDLYKYNPDSGALTSIWTLPTPPQERFVPGENMIWEPSEGCFYTVLIPDEKDFVLARIMRDKPTVDMASLPTEGIRRLCNFIYVNLFLNARRDRLYIASVQSEINGDTFLDILVLDYPIPPLSGIVLPPQEKKTPVLPAAIAFMILVTVAISLLLARKRNRRGDGSAYHPDNYYNFSRNSICLFGGFSVHDCNGNDITSQFTPTLRQLLTLLILYSSKDPQGVINARINKTIWYYKPEDSANNNRNVTIRRLRTILEEVDGVKITSKNKFWRIELSSPAQCDYVEALRLYREGKSKSDVNHLLELLLRGELLPDTSEEWTSGFKNDFSTMTVVFLSGQLSRNDFPESIIMQSALAVLHYDPLNEKALRTRCRILCAQGSTGLAKEAYDGFASSWQASFGNPYSLSFKEIIS